jgi:hypothetical protein
MTHYPILAILPTPCPPPSTQFHPRSPNTPKDQQRVTLCRLFKTFDPGSPACTILARWGGRSPNTAPDAVFRVVGWNAPKDRQRVTTLKCQNPASQPGFSSFDSRVAQPPSAVLYLRSNRHSLLPVQLILNAAIPQRQIKYETTLTQFFYAATKKSATLCLTKIGIVSLTLSGKSGFLHQESAFPEWMYPGGPIPFLNGAPCSAYSYNA